MKQDEKTSAAYRASQFILNNKNLIFCNCRLPVPVKNNRTGGYGIKIFCQTCSRLIEEQHPIGN